jgi:YD repeat-containing protein
VLFEIQDFAGLGLVTAMAYDGLDRPVSVSLPGGGQTLYAYDATTNPWANNLASVTRVPNTAGPPNLVTAYTYEATFDVAPTFIQLGVESGG